MTHPSAQCSCDQPGQCDRANRNMTPAMHARCQTDEYYRWLLSGIPRKLWPLTVVRQPTPAAASLSAAVVVNRPACVHLGAVHHDYRPNRDPLGNPKSCGGCYVHQCDVHNACTRSTKYPGFPCCDGCPDYCGPGDPESPKESTRHLIYHIYPISGNGAWEFNVDEISRRLPMFNGRKIVAIVTDPPDGRKPDPDGPYSPDRGRHYAACATVQEVKERFGVHADGVEFLEFTNDPHLREVLTLIPMLERLPQEPGHVTLYAQAKGTTRHQNHIARRWTEALYEILLDHWPLAEQQLRQFPVTGAFKKLGHGWSADQTKSDWHYSGSWFWFRNADLFARDWRKVDQFWSGIEPYPSQQFNANEAGCMFHTARVPQMNLYRPNYWRSTIRPAFNRWRAENHDKRTRYHGEEHLHAR
jgi:hypothetical protein